MSLKFQGAGDQKTLVRLIKLSFIGVSKTRLPRLDLVPSSNQFG